MNDALTPHGTSQTASLKSQRADLARMISELRELQASIKKQQGTDVQALIEENETLRRLVHELEQSRGAPADLTEIKGENELLHQLLQEKDQQIAELSQLINERAVADTSPTVPEDVDLDAFEAELRKERQQLEADRAKLTTELEQLRAQRGA